MEGEEVPRPPEQGEPILKLDLSQVEQRGIYFALLEGLTKETEQEIAGEIKMPQHVEELNAARVRFADIAGSLGWKPNTEDLLRAGLIGLVNPDKLTKIKEDSEHPMHRYAVYFSSKVNSEVDLPEAKI